jgi:hypothetical protein
LLEIVFFVVDDGEEPGADEDELVCCGRCAGCDGVRGVRAETAAPASLIVAHRSSAAIGRHLIEDFTLKERSIHYGHLETGLKP